MSVAVLALKIHMSEDAHNAIKIYPEFITECRGDIDIKVEMLLLYWLHFFYSRLDSRSPAVTSNENPSSPSIKVWY